MKTYFKKLRVNTNSINSGRDSKDVYIPKTAFLTYKFDFK